MSTNLVAYSRLRYLYQLDSGSVYIGIYMDFGLAPPWRLLCKCLGDIKVEGFFRC